MRRAAPWLALLGGTLLCAAGVAVFWSTNIARDPGDVGWYAYAPLSELTPAYQSTLTLSFDDDDRWSLVWTAGHLLGVGLLVLGLLVLAGSGGWLLGRRRGLPRARRALPALGAGGGLLTIGGLVAVATTGRGPVVTYGGSYEPLACPVLPGCGPGGPSVQLDAAQLAGLAGAVLGGALLTAVAAWWTAATRTGGVRTPGAVWAAVVVGALLAVVGVVLAATPPAVVPELAFVSPEQLDQLVGGSRRADAGRVLLALGALLAAAATGWLVGGHRRPGGAALGAGVGLALLGTALLAGSRSAVEAAAPVPLVGAGQWAGLALLLVGGALVGGGGRRVTTRRIAD